MQSSIALQLKCSTGKAREIRKAIQEIVVPELRASAARQVQPRRSPVRHNALIAQSDSCYDELVARSDSFCSKLTAGSQAHRSGSAGSAETQHNEILARFEIVDEKFERILATFAIDKKLGRLEERHDRPAS